MTKERREHILVIAGCLLAWFLMAFACSYQSPEEEKHMKEFREREDERERNNDLKLRVERAELEKRLREAH